MMTGKAERKHR